MRGLRAELVRAVSGPKRLSHAMESLNPSNRLVVKSTRRPYVVARLGGEMARLQRPEYELFAASMASGMSQRKSARRAGFHEDHGWRLMRDYAINARVEELRAAPGGCMRANILAELLELNIRAANG